jgi:serine/threonine protein kinase
MVAGGKMSAAAANVRIVGRYALYGVLASGGMATVHFGRLIGPVGFSRTVAIKRLHPQFAADPEFVAMFLDEARLAARIRHPNVVPTLDVVATSGELFLVMEYVPGESMARLVRAAKSRASIIPPSITVAIMVGVLHGLHAAHEAKNEQGSPLGIVHRDVSPQNVLVGADGQARVLDFGVAKAAGRVQTTREGQLKGKLAYMAPEQLRGEDCSRQTDIYAAAVILWEALSGERLFKADNEGAVIAKVLEGASGPPSRVTTTALDTQAKQAVERLDAIVMRGLARDSLTRFDTAKEMALALERALPPATASQVSEWVEGIASDVLLMRATQIAEIESSSTLLPRGLVPSVKSMHVANGEEPPAVPAAEIPIPSSAGAPTQAADLQSGGGLSSLSVASNTPGLGSRPSPRKSGLSVVGIVGMLVLVPIAAFAILRARPRAPDPLPPSEAASATSTSSPPPPPTGSGDTESPFAAKPQEGAGADAGLPAPSSSAVARTAPPKLSPPSDGRGVRKTAPTHANVCNPPFTYDSAGMKHYKPECL